MNYYKATNPAGRDFRTGSIDYAAALLSGETILHPAAKKVRDDASTYLSVSVSAADCTGFYWPCRLFRVEPVGRVMANLSVSPSKRAVSALRVVEELPAWQALGPNGKAVVAVIERAARLTADEEQRLRAAWDAARDAAWDVARDAAWAAARAAAWDAARAAAWDVARDAARAYLVRDLIADEHFEVLAGPWLSVFPEVTA